MYLGNPIRISTFLIFFIDAQPSQFPREPPPYHPAYQPPYSQSQPKECITGYPNVSQNAFSMPPGYQPGTIPPHIPIPPQPASFQVSISQFISHSVLFCFYVFICVPYKHQHLALSLFDLYILRYHPLFTVFLGLRIDISSEFFF